MSNRTAIDTIKGYFYQFDLSIEKLLNLLNDNDEITVEGVEDIDLKTSTETTAVQCKYYSKTEYNHSVIAKPIRLMLDHFKKVKDGIEPQIKYHLYGYYKSGQHKLTLPINITFLKDKFLTYTANKVQKKHYDILGFSDTDLQEFIDLLSIDINAKSYENQLDDILTAFMSINSCDKFDAEYYFYNNALNEIRKIAIENDITKRKISKKDFLTKINNKQILFNKWFLELKGKRNYHKELKDKYFRTLNKSPFERFFLIDLPSRYNITQLKELVFTVAKRYSKLSKREPQKFCPYIFFNNLSNNDLIELKKQLFDEDFTFVDGFPFLGAEFSPKNISIKPDEHNNIKIKILGTLSQIGDSLDFITKTKEVYQFYFNNSFFANTNNTIKCIDIQITDINNIKEII